MYFVHRCATLNIYNYNGIVSIYNSKRSAMVVIVTDNTSNNACVVSSFMSYSLILYILSMTRQIRMQHQDNHL